MRSIAYLGVLLILLSTNAPAALQEDVVGIRKEWERIKYQLAPKDQEAAFEKLVKHSEKVMAMHPTAAEPAIWHGIVEASYAGAKGGLGALAAAKNARKSFETALAIDPKALDGSAYTSLGSLYYQVPGWPIGFGDDKKARELLQKGIALNPDGIDPNYFYGDYLYRNGNYDEAEQVLNKALQAPPREGRKLADDGRRKEIAELLEKIRDRRR